jgi:hypothetical protein
MKVPPFRDKEIPARNGKKGTEMAKRVAKSSLELKPFGGEEIPAGNRNKGIQMAECVGKSNLELRKFSPLGSERIPARDGNDKSGGFRMEEGKGWSTTRLQPWVNTSVNNRSRDFYVEEVEGWVAAPTRLQPWVNIGERKKHVTFLRGGGGGNLSLSEPRSFSAQQQATRPAWRGVRGGGPPGHSPG